jgi:hypothetical protein
MMFTVLETPLAEGQVIYRWELWDGPDGIEHHEGVAGSIGQCLTAIAGARRLVASSYGGDW